MINRILVIALLLFVCWAFVVCILHAFNLQVQNGEDQVKKKSSFRDDLVWRDPFESMFDRSFHQWMSPFFRDRGRDLIWRPLSDVKETEKEMILHSDLPGVPKENIHVELKNNMLFIHGEKQENWEKKDKEKFHVLERTYGKFSRVISVPYGVSSKDVHATFKDGVLEVIVKKPEKQISPEDEKIVIH
jgi:HSP20 family protein